MIMSYLELKEMNTVCTHQLLLESELSPIRHSNSSHIVSLQVIRTVVVLSIVMH